MKSVVLAYYHNGFTDDAPELLDVCKSITVAKAVIAQHKLTRDHDDEFEDKATWWTERRKIRQKVR